MNRSLGIPAGTALLLLALRAATGGVPAPAYQAAVSTTTTTAQPHTTRHTGATAADTLEDTAAKLTGEGPWIASCRYWETSSPLDYPDAPEKKDKLSLEFKDDGGTIESKVDASSGETQSECERKGDSWGLPDASTPPAKPRPEITAIVAALPDPVHTHLALEFDRDIDSILQAAAENGFLVSQYWLPWQNPAHKPGPDAAASTEADAGPSARELQPGLIVLKYAGADVPSGQSADPVSASAAGTGTWQSYTRVIYLFLVGESPAYGMNGTQLRNALRYEAMLKKPRPGLTVKLSMRDPGSLSIIGSPNSGSATSLREAIEAAGSSLKISRVHIAGSTQTAQASNSLNRNFVGSQITADYLSFGEDFEFEQHETLNLLSNSGYRTNRVAFLVEDGTVFGDSGKSGPQGFEKNSGNDVLNPLIVRFPREISLLRNAQASEKADAAPSPYLRLTLKDATGNDTVPHFSAEQTPLSQEATLMSIQRDLVTYHVEFLAIQATNMLDKIYLANYFHRACPNIRLVFLGGADLILEREVDNVPYIGSVTMTPYNLVGLMRLPSNGAASRAFPDSHAVEMFNAASYTFQDPTHASGRNPILAGYEPYLASPPTGDPATARLHASLWATVIGADGYYPLAIASFCASTIPGSLSDFAAGESKQCPPDPNTRYPKDSEKKVPNDKSLIDGMQQFDGTAAVFPSLLWTVLSVVLGIYSIGHGVAILVADFWSPFTRDLAIASNDHPARRSVYLNIGTVMLVSMVFVLELPAFFIGPVLKLNRASTVVACAVLLAGVFALVATLWKTWRHSIFLPGAGRLKSYDSYHAACFFFNLVALLALVAIPVVWCTICSIDVFGQLHTGYGVFFSYRCLHPDSQVSPVVPVLLVLLAWFLWAYCQNFRLRFSDAGRPKLPGLKEGAAIPFAVTDAQLAVSHSPRDSGLFANITCLLITRETLVRFMPNWKKRVGIALAAGYLAVFFFVLAVRSIESVDRMVLDAKGHPTRYEALLVALTGPLLVIGLAGWLRMVLVWGSLRRGLLERLEMYPLRIAFTRLKGIGWMTMMRDTGLHTRWKDMARSMEAMRQLFNNDEARTAISVNYLSHNLRLEQTYAHLQGLVKDATAESRGESIARPTLYHSLLDPASVGVPEPPDLRDLPDKKHIKGLDLIAAIETDFATICEIVLEALLVPHWTAQRGGFIEAEAASPGKSTPANGNLATGDPEYIQLAEELLALRYLSLIRAVLGNVRYLMTFVSAAFVLSMIAWNSYPFQPREMLDWVFSVAFLILGGGIVWVFAQMHRNAILSRITDTAPNELGLGFYWRIITFGAVPLLTWLSYQFPQAWSGIFRLVQPGLSAMK